MQGTFVDVSAFGQVNRQYYQCMGWAYFRAQLLFEDSEFILMPRDLFKGTATQVQLCIQCIQFA